MLTQNKRNNVELIKKNHDQNDRKIRNQKKKKANLKT